MARISYAEKAELENRLRTNMRKMFFSKTTISEFLQDSSISYMTMMDEMLEKEIVRREENKKASLMKHAGFPSLKDINTFNWHEVTMPASLTTKEELLSLEFIEKKNNLIFYGVCGSGKTMLATCLGMAACKQGMKVKFMTLAQLSNKLLELHSIGNFMSFLNALKNVDLLIIDEWGYCKVSKESADLVYQVINACYEKRSLIVTTNLPFSEWGKIVVDEQLAAAIIDRVIHHGHLIDTGAVDYRIKASPMNMNTYMTAASGKRNE